MTMIERVARAMAENHWPVDFEGTKAGYVETHWHFHADDARAAIEAMREPTEAMKDAAFGNDPTLWSRMIDAALQEQP